MSFFARTTGKLLLGAIEQFVILFGKKYPVADVPYLDGPVGEPVIGDHFYQRWCAANAHTWTHRPHTEGLIPDFDILKSAGFNPQLVQPAIRDFYEHTADYDFDIRMKWNPWLKPFATVLVKTVSHYIQQLNFPLRPESVRDGMSSDIFTIRDAAGNIPFRCWLRKQMPGGEIIYCGFYTPYYFHSINGYGVKTVFPLPKGAAVVLLEPKNGENGSFTLISKGRRMGQPGYYRVHRTEKADLKVKMMPIIESLHLYVDETDTLRVDHTFRFLGWRLLHLHFKITRRKMA